jgi:hypothetical protein
VIVIRPAVSLERHATYRVTVKSAVTDLAGNGWDQTRLAPGNQRLRWEFATG